jgi:hypothetical protein
MRDPRLRALDHRSYFSARDGAMISGGSRIGGRARRGKCVAARKIAACWLRARVRPARVLRVDPTRAERNAGCVSNF